MTRGRGWRSATLAAVAVAAVAVLLPLATLLVSVWLLGWQLQSVQSGSMAPTYPVGSLLVVGQIDAGDVDVGMALVFEDPTESGRLVTHRVIEVVPGAALQFWTQGDANATRDAVSVPARLVRGRVLWHITLLGNITPALQWPWSFVAFVVVPGALLGLTEWSRRRRRPTPIQGEPAM